MSHMISCRRLAASAVAASIAAIGVVGIAAGGARATALGPWQQVAGAGLMNISEVGLARTPDGTLHVAWSSQQPDNTQSIYAVPISPSGGLGGVQTVVSGWAATDDPALGLTPSGGLQAFFGGIHTLAPNDPNAEMSLANSLDGGNSWSLVPAQVVAPGASAYASPAAVSNSFAGQGTPLETWYGTSGVWVHAGTDSGTPNSNFQTGLGCCGYYSNLASDGLGNTELAWYSNATGYLGVWAQAVSAAGAPIGSPAQMPGTSNMDVGEMQRTPLVARPQGGFYVAYPTGYPSFTAVRLWKVGGGVIKLANLGAAGGTAAVGEAVDQAGRIWVFWSTYSNDRARLFATRSNPAVTRFGAVVAVGAPSGIGTVFSVDGNAASGALDVFGTMSASGTSTAQIWTRHVYPGLSLTLSPASVRLRRAAKVLARVSDAGVPVKGASVRLGGHSARTNAGGTAVIRLRIGGSLTAVASRAGYVNASARLTARR